MVGGITTGSLNDLNVAVGSKDGAYYKGPVLVTELTILILTVRT